MLIIKIYAVDMYSYNILEQEEDICLAVQFVFLRFANFVNATKCTAYVKDAFDRHFAIMYSISKIWR